LGIKVRRQRERERERVLIDKICEERGEISRRKKEQTFVSEETPRKQGTS